MGGVFRVAVRPSRLCEQSRHISGVMRLIFEVLLRVAKQGQGRLTTRV
jgi:hypothetical protein